MTIPSEKSDEGVDSSVAYSVPFREENPISIVSLNSSSQKEWPTSFLVRKSPSLSSFLSYSLQLEVFSEPSLSICGLCWCIDLAVGPGPNDSCGSAA